MTNAPIGINFMPTQDAAEQGQQRGNMEGDLGEAIKVLSRARVIRAAGSEALPMSETTRLTLAEEAAFQAWARANGIRDVDHPDSRYDYRGYWKYVASQGGNQTKRYEDGLHFSDRFKQHGHPTFSVESQYSRGPNDGGRWVGEEFVPAGSDLLGTSRRATPSEDLVRAMELLMAGIRR